jgi:hypothetical protein
MTSCLHPYCALLCCGCELVVMPNWLANWFSWASQVEASNARAQGSNPDAAAAAAAAAAMAAVGLE